MKKNMLLIVVIGLMISACGNPGENSDSSRKAAASQKADSTSHQTNDTNRHRPAKGPVNVAFSTPVIKGYGGEHYFADASVQPDPKIDYKVVFLIAHNDAKAEPNDGLVHIARLINLLHDAGVKPNHINIVGVLTGPATSSAITDSTYKKMFTVANPNDALFTELTNVGHVKLYVCAQALSGMGYGPSYLNPNVKMALSALTTVTTYQLKGYALMQF